MSENSPATKTFQQRADEFIAVANQQVPDSSVDDVNAFSVARSFESAENMQAEKQEAMKFFIQRYTEMLEQNMDEYISRFESYSQQ